MLLVRALCADAHMETDSGLSGSVLCHLFSKFCFTKSRLKEVARVILKRKPVHFGYWALGVVVVWSIGAPAGSEKQPSGGGIVPKSGGSLGSGLQAGAALGLLPLWSVIPPWQGLSKPFFENANPVTQPAPHSALSVPCGWPLWSLPPLTPWDP